MRSPHEVIEQSGDDVGKFARGLHWIRAFFAVAAVVCSTCEASAQLPNTDQRGVEIKTLNTPRAFPVIKTKSEWDKRAKDIREQILVSAGLWPIPEKTSLNASVFGKIDHGDYTVEKVYFESLPGFYVGGNLYRPVGKKGPLPAILNPHGHWAEGRLVDTTNGSVAARCINFARQGMIAFSYDMVGFNDTHFPLPSGYKHDSKTFYAAHRHFATNTAVPMLWNINLMGLQLWNSIRAVDFLRELYDVDKLRIGCTGASGGGTQTFMLGAVDDRIAADAPVVMVSHIMQGGCGCENMPGLRVEFSNMEIAAAFAPRPQIMVGASGDWTKTMMTVEGPAVESVYKLFDAADRLRYVRFESVHNYNKTSREAVYGWLDKYLGHVGDGAPVTEVAYTKDADDLLRVFPDNKLPANAVSEQQLINYLMQRTQRQLDNLMPHGKASFAEYKKVLRPAWKHTLQLEIPENGMVSEVIGQKDLARDSFNHEAHSDYSSTRMAIGRAGKNDRISAVVVYPRTQKQNTFVLIASPRGVADAFDNSGNLRGLAAQLVVAGIPIIAFDAFTTATNRNETDLFFTTYNRTLMQERVQDIATLSAFARGSGKASHKLVLIGEGEMGLAAMLAAPLVNAVIADCTAADASDLFRVRPEVFVPGLKSIGDFNGVAALAAPNPILVCAGKNFSVDSLKDVYKALRAAKEIRTEYSRPKDEEIVKWIMALK
jgi:dienelactone hydrolase